MRPVQRSGRGLEAFPEGRERSECPSVGPSGIGMHSWRAYRGRAALQMGREGSVALLEVW